MVIVQNFIVALALGALIGLEREYARYRKKGHDYAGIRTFPLIALFGALAAYLGETIDIMVFVVSVLLVGVVIGIAYFKIIGKDRKHVGATSEIAGFLTFFMGALAYYGEINLAVTLAIIMTVILYSRSMLHNFAKHIQKKEFEDTLKFAVIAFVILPFLPNQGYGPLELFNPFIIRLMVVFVTGISFAGYILMKWLGEKGIVLGGILGGLVSSTATTTSFAERSKKEKMYSSLALGVILANGVMFVRILLEVFVLNRKLFIPILFPMLVLMLITAVFSFFLWRKSRNVKGKVKLGSPFTLGPAIKFGIIFAAILGLVKLADVYLSSQGVYLVSFISGFADVDAITVSLSQLSQSGLSLDIARDGIIIATLTNMATKGGIAYWFGRKEFGRIVLWFFVALIIVGVGFLWF